MTKRKVAPKEGAAITKRSANVLCSEIEAIIAHRKRVTPKSLLDRARPEDSPIHRMFEWDDSKAAEKHRLDQARKLIASVEITVVNVDHPVRAYHSIPVRVTTGSARREFVTRDVVIRDSEAMANISADRYATLVSTAKYITDIGLAKSDPAWGALVRAIGQNVPNAVKRSQDAA